MGWVAGGGGGQGTGRDVRDLVDGYWDVKQ